MANERYINFLKGSDDMLKIEIIVRDAEGVMVELLKHIGGSANPGHSFKVVIDPNDEEYSKNFYIDGDGGFYLKEIKVNGEKI